MASRPSEDPGIESLVERLEHLGARLRLDGGSLEIENADLVAATPELTELTRRADEAVGYLASRAPRPILPRLTNGSIQPESIPLSHSQKQWVAASDVFVEEQWLPMVWHLVGDLDLAAFMNSYRKLIRRHDILRVMLIDAESNPRQHLLPLTECELKLETLTEFGDPEMELWRRMRAMYDDELPRETRVNRLRIYRLGDRHHVLGGYLHHAVLDEGSLAPLLGELHGAYLRLAQGLRVPDVRPPFQYSDFVAWERACITQSDEAVAEKFWRYVLKGSRPVVLGAPSAAGNSASALETAQFALDASELQSAMGFAKAERIPFNLLFLVALSLALSRATGRDDCLLGHSIQRRPRGCEHMIGNFVQVRPLYLRISEDWTVRELLQRAMKVYSASAETRWPVSQGIRREFQFDRILVNYLLKTERTPVGSRHPGSLPAGHGVSGNRLRQARPADEISGEQPEARADLRHQSGLGSREAAAPPQPKDRKQLPDLEFQLQPLRQLLRSRIKRDFAIGVFQTSDKLSAQVWYAADRIPETVIDKLIRNMHDSLTRMTSGAQETVGAILRELS